MSAIASNTVKLLINGEFVESRTTEWRDVVNPATQQVLARVPFATAGEVDEAIRSAHAAFKTWKDTPIGARMRIMLKYQALIREHMPAYREDVERRAGQDDSRCRRRYLPRTRSGRTCVFHR